jgi:ribosomal protein S1
MWSAGEEKESRFKDGEAVRCRVVAVEGSRIDLSLRASRLSADGAVEEDPLPEEGAVVKGYVISTGKTGCFVRLSRSVTARVLLKVSDISQWEKTIAYREIECAPICEESDGVSVWSAHRRVIRLCPWQDLSDSFLQDPSKEFPPGRLVAGRVLAVKPERRMVDLSLKPSVVVGKFMHKVTFDDLKEGMKVRRTGHFFIAALVDDQPLFMEALFMGRVELLLNLRPASLP